MSIADFGVGIALALAPERACSREGYRSPSKCMSGITVNGDKGIGPDIGDGYPRGKGPRRKARPIGTPTGSR